MTDDGLCMFDQYDVWCLRFDVWNPMYDVCCMMCTMYDEICIVMFYDIVSSMIF